MNDQPPIRLEPDELYLKREQEKRLERRAELADELFGEWKRTRIEVHHLERDLRAALNRETIVRRLVPHVTLPREDPEKVTTQAMTTRLDEVLTAFAGLVPLVDNDTFRDDAPIFAEVVAAPDGGQTVRHPLAERIREELEEAQHRLTITDSQTLQAENERLRTRSRELENHIAELKRQLAGASG